MVVAALIQGLLGIALILLGRWGLSRGADLAPAWLDEQERADRASVARRGSLLCIGVGGLLVAFALLVLLLS